MDLFLTVFRKKGKSHALKHKEYVACGQHCGVEENIFVNIKLNLCQILRYLLQAIKMTGLGQTQHFPIDFHVHG